MSRQRETIIRRWLGLGERPDPIGVSFVPTDHGTFTMESAPEAERQTAVRAYHAEDWRARLAETLAFAPQKAGRSWQRLNGSIDQQRAAHRLSQAHQLRFTSWHIHPIGETVEIEGYFALGDDLQFPLQILAGQAFEQLAQEDWAQDKVTHSSGSIYGYDRWLIIPGDSLNDELVHEAITRWYRDRFEWVQGHWSQREDRLPTIELDLAWEDPDKLRADMLHPSSLSGDIVQD